MDDKNKKLSTTKKASKVYGKVWSGMDARMSLEEDSVSSDGTIDNHKNSKFEAFKTKR